MGGLWGVGVQAAGRDTRDSTDVLLVCLYYPVFRIWAGYVGFGI